MIIRPYSILPSNKDPFAPSKIETGRIKKKPKTASKTPMTREIYTIREKS